jgi:ABC-type phosphate transport system substrate-binding protein
MSPFSVGVIVHPENPLESLPLEEVKAIFTGEIKKWPAVRGAAAAMRTFGLRQSSPITQLLKEKLRETALPPTHTQRERGSGGRKTLRYAVQRDTARVILAVAREPAGIGFVDMSQLPPHEKSVKRVPVYEGRGSSPHPSPLPRGEGTGDVRRGSSPHPSPLPRGEGTGQRDSPMFAARKSGQSPPVPLVADSLPENDPLARTLVLYVSPKASQTANDFADFLTPEHCKETIAQYSLLAPLHAEGDQ